jgi:branched-chain amino acid transport system substrate-binding protein
VTMPPVQRAGPTWVRRALPALALLAAATAPCQEPPPPWNRAGRAPLEFRGPGRERPDPALGEVRLGWFGPFHPDDPRGGDPWRGAALALEEENAAGGYAGTPFRLVPAWSENPWTGGGVELTRLVYVHDVRAVVGGIDGATTHLAEQVALKARLALVSPGSTDETANLASVPWLFSCLPSDAALAPRLVDALEEALDGGPFAVASVADHDAHATLAAVREVIDERGLSPALVLELDATKGDLGPDARRLIGSGASGAIVLASASDGARIVGALRSAGFTGSLVGGPALALNAFGRAAGDAAEGIVVPLLREPGERWAAFARVYGARWGEMPDHAAGAAYDAVRLLAAAVRGAGLERSQLRDGLRALSPWRGAAGSIDWDTLGRNRRPVGLAVWRQGRLQPLTRAEQSASAGAGLGQSFDARLLSPLRHAGIAQELLDLVERTPGFATWSPITSCRRR